MFFQTIHQLITTGTDLSINIRRVENSLSVSVIPRRNSLKGDMQQNMVPLVMNGTPEELDMQFLRAISQPIQKVQGLLTNAENFEKQAEKAAQSKKPKTISENTETKEAREKREKMERLIAKAGEADKNRHYQEALTWLKQARVLATPEKQKEIDGKVVDIQKKAAQGSLFGEMTSTQEAQPVATQPNPHGNTVQPSHPIRQNPPQYNNTGEYRQAQTTAVPQHPAGNGTTARPANMQPDMFPPQPQQPTYRQPPMETGYGQQPIPQQPQQPEQTLYSAGGNGHVPPSQQSDNFCFDMEDENDRELLREDPYAQYQDFPPEYRMKDEAQLEAVYC